MRVFLFGLFFWRIISRISNVGLYNCFSYSYLTYCLISCTYVLIFTIHFFCTRVPDMHATWLYHMYSLGCFLTNLNAHIQIIESGPGWPRCNWSECAVDPSVTIGAQQKFGLSPQLFLPVPLLIGSLDPSYCSWAPLSFVYLFIYCILLYFLVM